jgi:hypothetical protein
MYYLWFPNENHVFDYVPYINNIILSDCAPETGVHAHFSGAANPFALKKLAMAAAESLDYERSIRPTDGGECNLDPLLSRQLFGSLESLILVRFQVFLHEKTTSISPADLCLTTVHHPGSALEMGQNRR